jgi:hypothetical protein
MSIYWQPFGRHKVENTPKSGKYGTFTGGPNRPQKTVLLTLTGGCCRKIKTRTDTYLPAA